MSVRIGLLRGINVGGTSALPMQQLRAVLAELGLEDAETILQSGNRVFRAGRGAGGADRLAGAIARAVERRCAIRPAVLVLLLARFERILAANPFEDPAHVHIHFLLRAPAAAGRDRLDALRSGAEAFWLTSDALYLLAPDGVGRSKLAAGIERCLSVPATARNMRTVTRIAARARVLAGAGEGEGAPEGRRE